jgi:hypothetical protein
LFDNINAGMLDKRSNSQPSVDNVQLKLKPNIIEPTNKQKDRLLAMLHAQSKDEKTLRQSSASQPVEVRQSQIIEDKIVNSQYIASGSHYYQPPSGSSTAKS